jgi:hypothetical protein
MINPVVESLQDLNAEAREAGIRAGACFEIALDSINSTLTASAVGVAATYGLLKIAPLAEFMPQGMELGSMALGGVTAAIGYLRISGSRPLRDLKYWRQNRHEKKESELKYQQIVSWFNGPQCLDSKAVDEVAQLEKNLALLPTAKVNN